MVRLEHAICDGLYVRECGSDSAGPPLVWVHGLGESGLCFESIARSPELSGLRQLIPDLPGYGRSPHRDEPLSLEAAGRRLVRLLELRKALPAVFIGHSMGGVLVQLLLENQPSAAAGFVNVDGNVTRPDCHFSGQAVAKGLDAFLDGRFASLLDGVYRAGLDEEALRGYYTSLRLADPRAFYRNSEELVAASLPEDLARRMAGLACSKLYVAGRPGGASEGSLERLSEAGVPTETIAPSGHWPFIDQPQTFSRCLAAFLARLGG